MTGIIAAMQSELCGLAEIATDVREEVILSIAYITGKIDGTPVVMAVSGEGKVNAAVCAQTMILHFGAERIINTGVAGSLSRTLHVPDVAVATASVQHDYDLSPLGYARGMVLCGRRTENTPDGDKATIYFKADERIAGALYAAACDEGVHAECGVIATGDMFVACADVKERLVKDYSAIACEMEGGAVGQVCCVAGIPYGILRAISDNADENAPQTFDPMRAAAISVAVTRRALGLLS